MGKSRVQVPQEAGIFLVFQEPRPLLLDEPTRGVVSSEDEEVLAISDDVVVFHESTCDSTTHEPIDLKVGDLRRLAWTPSESRVASRR